jgi:hypothetical protein
MVSRPIALLLKAAAVVCVKLFIKNKDCGLQLSISVNKQKSVNFFVLIAYL